MKRKFGLIGGVLAVALALIYLALFRSEENTAAPAVSQPDTPAAARDARVFGGLFPRRAHVSATNAFARRAGAPRRTVDGGAPSPSSAADAGAEENETLEPATAEEQAVAAWEALIDQAAEVQEVAPSADQAQRVKEAFDRLEKRVKMESLHTALNLLPDEQFLLLYGILFNKQEDPEILDDIFSDMLNRPEEIKVPIMKALMADKTHPMYVEAARILDVTGELDDLQGETAEGQAAGPAAGNGTPAP